jgi:hypothetical protein
MTRESEGDPVHFSDWLALLGFQKEEEAIQFIRGQVLQEISEEAWLERIRRANRAADLISNRWSSSPEIRELNGRFEDRLKTLAKEPTFQGHLIGTNGWRFALVELEKLHAIQTQLNSEYVDSLIATAPSATDLDATVRFCLPTREEKGGKVELATSLNPNTNTISIVTDNLDFRVAGNVEGQDPKTGTRFYGFGVGAGLPHLSVANCKGRYFIRNGYHRAYALLRKGHKFLPCLLVNMDRIEDIGFWGPAYLPLKLVLSDKSPIISDYGAEVSVRIPRRRLKMLLSIHAELHAVPV